ncbi:ATP-binding protein [Kitasatospora sp. NPDC096147]|uniref:sensor histidine kinase n=1 Tax=Kitasatospora sp. NPDC096147 TaxID=3364093 RepID=UPI003804BA94
MLGAGSSSGDRRPAAGLGWLLPTAVTAAAAAVATVLMDGSARWAVGWCGGVATLIVAVVAAESARRGRALATFQERAARQEAELRQQLADQEEQTARLAEALPQAVARLQGGEFLEDVLRESGTGSGSAGFQQARHAVLRTVLEAVDAEEGLRESAQRAFVNIARRVQAIVHRQAQDLREMEDRHGNDPAVFEDLLRLDHGNALVGRLADSIAVLGGARPGRQWSKGVPLYSVLRGAVSRILDYQRVELHPVSEVAVVGPAVEPLIHALAELLDNATRYSPPQTNVHLTAVEVQTGIAIEIEDGGLSLSEEGRARAERMLREAQEGIDLKDLGETPRLGLAVVGRLAQAYGFQVSLRPSAYGGVRAVLIVPQDLLTATPASSDWAHGIGAVSGPRPAAAVAAPVRAAVTGPRLPVGGQQAGPQHAGVQQADVRQAGAPGSGVERGGVEHGWAEDAPVVVTERAASGLPQRRRHARPAAEAPAAPAAQQYPGRQSTGQYPAARHTTGQYPTGQYPTAPAPVAVPATPAPAAPAADPVQPGMWLAAFSDGVNGQSERTSDQSSGTTASTTRSKGEQ